MTRKPVENSPDSHKPVENRRFAALRRSRVSWHGKGSTRSPRTALLGEKRLPRATMQMRLLAAQANVEEKRIAELKARLKENLSLLDRERTCRELTRMQGELIKTSLFPT